MIPIAIDVEAGYPDRLMPGIFISYRREDSGPYAGRLYDGLVAHLGRDSIFFDIDTINPGEDFREAIRRTLDDCDVLLAVIGQHWVTVCDKNGKPRLESSRDFVRIEIASALTRGIRVIPVLVGGADMPDESLLPADLQPLAFRNAWEISDKRFHSDVQLLIDALKRISSPSPHTPKAAPPATPQARRTTTPGPDFLTLHGVTLGKTPVRELAKLGTRADSKYLCYDVSGMNFWFSDKAGVAESVYITYSKEMPGSWQKLGFDWNNSYEEWLALLDGLGYSIEVEDEPHLEVYDGHNALTANVTALSEHPGPHRIELDFCFSEGTETTSQGTLYSIDVKATG